MGQKIYGGYGRPLENATQELDDLIGILFQLRKYHKKAVKKA